MVMFSSAKIAPPSAAAATARASATGRPDAVSAADCPTASAPSPSNTSAANSKAMAAGRAERDPFAEPDAAQHGPADDHQAELGGDGHGQPHDAQGPLARTYCPPPE